MIARVIYHPKFCARRQKGKGGKIKNFLHSFRFLRELESLSFLFFLIRVLIQPLPEPRIHVLLWFRACPALPTRGLRFLFHPPASACGSPPLPAPPSMRFAAPAPFPRPAGLQPLFHSQQSSSPHEIPAALAVPAGSSTKNFAGFFGVWFSVQGFSPSFMSTTLFSLLR